MIINEKTVENAEKSTVSSKKIGKNAGSVRQSNGLPWTMIGYSAKEGMQVSSTAVRVPVAPPMNTGALNQDLLSPIALSMP